MSPVHSLYGPTSPLKLYGEHGDRCPGCGGLLSAYNPQDRCAACGGGKKRPERRRGPASDAGMACTESAPEPRRVTMEEVQMAAKQRQEMSDSKKAVLAALTGEYDAAPVIAERAEVKESLAYYHLKRLVENGHAEHKLGKGGGYRRRDEVVVVKDGRVDRQASEAAQAASSDDAKSATPAAADPSAAAPVVPAPPTEAPEQPAEPAAPDPPRESPAAGIPPFAGVDPTQYTAGWSLKRAVVTVELDIDELAEAVMERIAARMVGK